MEPPSESNSCSNSDNIEPKLDLAGSAQTHYSAINPDLQNETNIARDREQPILTRINAFEDIMDSEIGDTNLTRVRNVEREVGLRQLFLKLEGGNPSGSHKDRVAFAQVMDALRRGFDGIVVAAGTNYAAAVALAASLAGLRCVVFLLPSRDPPRLVEIQAYSAEVRRASGDLESATKAAQQLAEEQGLYDACYGGANTAVQLQAYGQIAHEIYDELRDAPAVIALPVANGTTLVGIYRGFLNLYRRGKTSRMPRFVAGSSFARNPVVQAFRKQLSRCSTVKPVGLRADSDQSSQISWSSGDNNSALESIRATGGWASHVSDRSLFQYARRLRELDGIDVLPASCAGLLALIEQHNEAPLPGDRYVVVITGK